MNASTDRQTDENGQAERDEGGRFATGNPGGPGRAKGEPNRIPGAVKEDILTAYAERGGIDWLRSLSDRLFVRLLEKTMPKQIAAEVKAAWAEQGDSDWKNVPDRELEARGQVLGMKIRRVDGGLYFYEDAEEALSLHTFREIVRDLDGSALGPVERECLEHTIAALRRRLPELQALLPKAEAALAAMRARESHDTP
ncbi:MAG TPA: hypothetical protein VNA25_28540 [Phycisphaerae bacterium]|nr:hypothetical protein [Phycisphaerae bacterium]